MDCVACGSAAVTTRRSRKRSPIGRTKLSQRKGATGAELAESRRNVLIGMIFSNVVMYFIILSTAATLHKSGHTNIETAADAAQALRPLAGNGASLLFLIGVIGVGLLAVPVMTAGVAYDLAQIAGWKHSLHAKLGEAKAFYAAIAGFTLVGVLMNFLGFNPMQALIWAGVVQGFSTPPLLLLIVLMTSNCLPLNILGWATTLSIFAASFGLQLVSVIARRFRGRLVAMPEQPANSISIIFIIIFFNDIFDINRNRHAVPSLG